jgi:dsRNA-specific ribonuclease
LPKEWKQVTYKVIARYKVDKRDRFKVAVFIDGEKIAIADDFNKKSAEQAASKKAINSQGIAKKPAAVGS